MKELGGLQSTGRKELDTTEQLHFHFSHLWIYWGFPSGSVVKNLPANVGDTGDVGSMPGPGRFPGEGNGNPLQSSCLENPHGQRSLVGYNP